jgi:hypothetical protein
MRETEAMCYLIRVKKQADVLTDANRYLRQIFRNLQRTPAEDTSVILINTRRHLLFLTSPIHREDAYRMFIGWGSLPTVEVYPILRDAEQGYPYRRLICLRYFPNRKSTRLPKVAGELANFRWVAYRKGSEVEGLLISEDGLFTAPYPCELSTEAFLITANADELCYSDLIYPSPTFTVPLLPPAEGEAPNTDLASELPEAYATL